MSQFLGKPSLISSLTPCLCVCLCVNGACECLCVCVCRWEGGRVGGCVCVYVCMFVRIYGGGVHVVSQVVIAFLGALWYFFFFFSFSPCPLCPGLLAMSHIWMSHVTHMKEPCQTYESVMSHKWTSRITHMKESRDAYEWVMSHMSEACHTHESVMSHMIESLTHTHKYRNLSIQPHLEILQKNSERYSRKSSKSQVFVDF